jgi:DNA-binding response OmpR family regulator
MNKNENYKILITEDESAMRNALSDKFAREGFEVISAQDGEEGLKLAIENKPDLVMLDIIMPKMDGITVMKNIRDKGSWGEDVPILMLTNLSDPESVSEAAKFKVYDFLVKTDWRLDDIVKLVKEKLSIEI